MEALSHFYEGRRKTISMLGPLILVPLTSVVLLGAAYWHLLSRDIASFVALGVAATGLLGTIVSCVYRNARTNSAKEDQIEKRMRRTIAMQYASTQAKHEMEHFELILDNPRTCAGKRYAEQSSFEAVTKRMRALLSYPDFAEQAQWVIDECERNLKLPSGQKDVRALVVILQKFIEDIDAWLATNRG
jgi:hypothetical protein